MPFAGIERQEQIKTYTQPGWAQMQPIRTRSKTSPPKPGWIQIHWKTQPSLRRFVDPWSWTCLSKYHKGAMMPLCELGGAEAQPSPLLWYWFSLADTRKCCCLRARLPCALNTASKQTSGSSYVLRSLTSNWVVSRALLSGLNFGLRKDSDSKYLDLFYPSKNLA